MKIKIKDFKGIFTNNDENDNRLELCTDSQNFLHKRGFLEIDPRHLKDYGLTAAMPLPNGTFPTNTGTGFDLTWTFETGIYTTLSSDILSTASNPMPGKHDLLVLIAKAEENGTYHRLVYLWDFTENGPFWYEMSKNGNYIRYANVPIIDIENASDDNNFTNSAFSTTIDGDVHFQVEDGRLKIYMPHDTFWLGKIDRKIYARDDKHRWPIVDPGNAGTSYPLFDYENDYWYIDRIVDHWKHDNQTIRAWDQDNLQQFPWFDAQALGGVTCAKSPASEDKTRRSGLMYKLFVEEDPNHVIDGRDIIISDAHDHKIRTEDNWSNFRCTRHTLTSVDGFPLVNPFGTHINTSIFSFWIDARRIPPEVVGDPDEDWTFTHGQESQINITFLPYGVNAFRIRGDDDGSLLEGLESYRFYEAGTALVYLEGTLHDIPEAMWSVSIQDFQDNNWEYGGDLKTSDEGWTQTENKFSIIVTAVLDDREEIPIAAHNWEVDPDDTYILTISDITVPWDMNKRITRIKFYHKLKDATDYEMVKEMDLLAKESSIEPFDISKVVYNGFFLATQTGFLWDYYDHPADMRIINGWKDFVTESGISVGISTRDEVAVYHSTLGGGNLMPDLIYDDNRLPITGVSELTAVANADGRLMAFTPHTAYVITAQEVAGVIAFRFEDTVEVGVKNKNDIANIQGGVLVHTRHGIYITNGYETNTISQPIDNIIRENYATGRVYYNRYEHEVYYKPTDAEDLYRFRLYDSVWEHLNKTVTPTEIESEVGEVPVD